MVVKDFPQLFEWLLGGSGDDSATGAIFIFLLLVLATSLLGLFWGYLVAAFRHGPGEAFYIVAKVVAGAGPDWLGISARRISAIARLAIKEAIRRKVLLVTFAIFALALLFGGWFIGGGEHPDRTYINFVMFGTQLLVLLLVLLVSAFSLPDDIKNRTIFTVSTKPVRASEIVLGRILGFIAIGTVLLAVMGLISLLFVWRGLSHTHQLAVNDNGKVEFRPVDKKDTGHRASENAVLETLTTFDAGHTHFVEIVEDVRGADDPPPANPDSIISTETRGDLIVYRRLQVMPASGHSHDIAISGEGDDAEYTLSDVKGLFRARRPMYAERLLFYDRQGQQREQGLNTGDSWTYRGYIAGGITLSKAEFLFEDFTESRFVETDVLPLELTLAVFRSTKGDIYSRIRAGLQFDTYIPASGANPPRRFRSELIEFETAESTVQVKGIPRKIPGQVFGPEGELLESGVYDLFDDFASNGNLLLTIRCIDENQYLGMARADVYFRVSDEAYWWNFVRGYVGIWLQMVIVTCLGVAFSTFLSAPVTLMGVVLAVVFGFFSESIKKLTVPDVEGGGPIEAFYRLITQKNQVELLGDAVGFTIMKEIDKVFLLLVSSVTKIVPDFSRLDFSSFLTYGYFIDSDRLGVAFLISLAFCIGLTLMGYFFLKTRELAG